MNTKIPYKYCPKCGDDLSQKKANMLLCADCGFEYYINPAPCVGILIENKEGNILLARRARSPYKGTWDTVGGFVDMGESLEETALREAKEETNLECSAVTYIGSNTGVYLWGGADMPILNLYVSARIDTYDHMRPADDVSELRFFAYENIPYDDIPQKHLVAFLRDYKK